MSRNTLADLNNHLFAQLERLGDESLKDDELRKEMDRAKAINGVAKNVVDNAKLALEGAKFRYKDIPGNDTESLPEQFRIK